VDGVSGRILVPDLATAWTAIAADSVPVLPQRGTSFRSWSQRLWQAAHDDARVSELAFWRDMLNAPSLSPVAGLLDAKRDVAGAAGQLTLTLPARITGALLTRVPEAFHCGINDVLLTGLALAIVDWCRRRGVASSSASDAVLIDVEGHGREEIFADVDLSHTVGWFTSLFPVRLDASAIDITQALAGGAALGQALKPFREQLQALPGKATAYGLLRYLNPSTAG